MPASRSRITRREFPRGRVTIGVVLTIGAVFAAFAAAAPWSGKAKTVISPTLSPSSMPSRLAPRSKHLSSQPAGYPVSPAAVRQYAENQAAKASPSLLDEVGLAAKPTSPLQVASWKDALHHPLSPSRAAQLEVKLGEITLVELRNPDLSLWHFHRAEKLSPPN
ncbi:MAG: hypothetical protein LC772_06465, partial [Chloroflexi bacterium]|nr:hypothetical protein [Chloroflexota bacterium]